MKGNDQTTLRQSRDRVPSSPALPSGAPPDVRAPAAPISAHGIEGAADNMAVADGKCWPSVANTAGAEIAPLPHLQSASAIRTASDLDREHLLTIPEAACLARVSPRTIQREIGKRPAWALRFGCAWRIDRERFIEAGRRAARQAV